MDKRCLGCMELFNEEFDICPHCGHADGAKAQEALHMDPGTYLKDRYIIGRVLGFGGFGVTYMAWDAKLEQKVAIKEYLPSEFSTRAPGHSQVTIYDGVKNDQFLEGLNKFVDEAKRLAKFHNTTGIVKVFDAFTENDTAYIIMEYLNGQTLAQLLKTEKTMPYDRAVNLLLPVMQSMETVHAEGVIHRDIAPDNIFITSDGEAKLIDFGASRFASTSVSRSMTVIVKPGYSPEEQYRSRGDHGPHTDVYSIAATLYKIFTGKTPPDALERRATFEKSGRDILMPIDKLTKDVPESIENSVLNAMNVRIEDRTPTMSALMADLQSTEYVARIAGKIKKIDILRWPLWAKIASPIAAAGILTAAVMFATGFIGTLLAREIKLSDFETYVPDIVNSEMDAARNRLAVGSLNIYVEGQEFSDFITMGFVEQQSPSGGLIVSKNSNVNVRVSAGIDGETVPNLIGLPFDAAKEILEQLGFRVEISEDYHDVIAAGCVIDQSISPGSEHSKGGTVIITLSKGRNPDSIRNIRAVAVPDFVGMLFNDALQKAAQSSVSIMVSERRFSETVPENTVMEQTPPNGEMLMNDIAVELVVSSGSEKARVPFVVGAQESAAKDMLEKAGLTVRVVYEESANFSPGTVMSQSIEAKTDVAPKTLVTITVCAGVPAFPLANVVGMSENEARAALSQRGLVVSVSYESDRNASVGSVIRQNPPAGTDVKQGDVVSIVVCSRNPVVEVPSVVGLTQSDAVNALRQLGFSAAVGTTYHDSIEAGRVISQTPTAASGQLHGTTVNIIVSLGRKPIAVANVIGSEQGDAENTLRSQGFSVSSETVYHDTIASGLVISQSPAAGSEQTPGTNISLTVSKGRHWVDVPSVTGLGESDAGSRLTALGFGVVVTKDHHESINRGLVISQNAEGQAIFGSSIGITISRGTGGRWITPENLGDYPSSEFDIVDQEKEWQYRWSSSTYEVMSKTGSSPTAPVENGWTHTGTVMTGWNSWSAWVDGAAPAAIPGQMNVETGQRDSFVHTGYFLQSFTTQRRGNQERMYRSYSINGDYTAHDANSSYGEFYHHGTCTIDQYNSAPKFGYNAYASAGTFPGRNWGNGEAIVWYDQHYDLVLMFVYGDMNTNEPVAQYRTQTAVYTYSYDRAFTTELNSWSTTKPPSGGRSTSGNITTDTTVYPESREIITQYFVRGR